MMTARYRKGQKVVIKPINEGALTTRDSALQPYTGQIGKVTDYHWISIDRDTKVVYVYTVLVDSDQQEIVLHEDELQSVVE